MAEPGLKLNLGSGLIVAPGWIHVDLGRYAPLGLLPRSVLRLLYERSGWRKIITADQYVAALKDYKFVRNDLRKKLPFADGSVEVVFSSHCLDLLTADEGARLLAEIHRVLKPGGLVRLSTADLEIAVELYRGGERSKALRLIFPIDTFRRWMYDAGELEQALRSAGFAEVTRCKFGEGRLEEARILDTRPEQSIFVEAIRPAGSVP